MAQPRADHAAPRVERQFARFTELTGIRIEGQRAPYLEMKAHQLESLAKPAGDFDLLAS